jgi:hypothetical protein
MKLSSRKELLSEAENEMKKIRGESLNEAKIMVKGKMVEEPEKYVIRCYKEPNDVVRNSKYGNLKKGDYLVQTGPAGPYKGTSDLKKATIYNTRDKMSYGSRSDRGLTVFFWNLVKKSEKFEMGDFFEPLPVEVKVVKTVKLI